ncbi:cyclin-C [Sporothrix brasiliensis 5110]|uniref:RNA polymerase II holoenzyme cyclin-like subunit n=1 Tax=Sporothrix brasiliensis 5110 TaxID=1398154 RepID=A0A0C2IMV7_9PEZI|nr:cyclin-C [Sporothrix brasiliensis 5110]KIH86322.1 cyclin-C [Sporothrix brasiliensis 5110]
MAASYWDSTQRRFWEFSKEQLAALRQRKQDEERSLVQMYPLPEWRHLSLFFSQQLNRLAKRLQARQQALATAQVYLKRFYCKVEIRRTNPYLAMATALYLACKTEECPQHIRQVVQEAKVLWPDTHCLEIARLGECEFFMISELSSHLIIHAPYRTLQTLQAELGLTPDELTQAWSIVNDHYMTDLPLLYPPHVIAVTAIVWVLVLQPATSGGSNNGGGIGLMGQTMGTANGSGSGGNHTGVGGNNGAAPGGMGVGGSSSIQPPPLLLSLSSLGPGTSTPGGGTPGTPGMSGMGTPTTAGGFPAMSSARSVAFAHAQAQVAAAAALLGGGGPMQHMPQGMNPGAAQSGYAGGNNNNNNNNNNNSNSVANASSSNSNTASEETPPADGGRTATMHWLIRWLAESGLDMEATIDCTQEMISFYMASEEYNEKLTREQINRFVKARGLDR